MKRNDVVMNNNNDMFGFYGRVIRVIDNKVLWICSGLHIHLTNKNELQVVDYKGRDINGRFRYMTTLRKLKQKASKYHGRNVWKTSLDYKYLSK